MPVKLGREISTHADDVRTANRIGEIAALPAQRFPNPSRRFGFCFAHKCTHRRVGCAPNQDVNVITEYRLGENDGPRAPSSALHRIRDDRNRGGTDRAFVLVGMPGQVHKQPASLVLSSGPHDLLGNQFGWRAPRPCRGANETRRLI